MVLFSHAFKYKPTAKIYKLIAKKISSYILQKSSLSLIKNKNRAKKNMIINIKLDLSIRHYLKISIKVCLATKQK